MLFGVDVQMAVDVLSAGELDLSASVGIRHINQRGLMLGSGCRVAKLRDVRLGKVSLSIHS